MSFRFAEAWALQLLALLPVVAAGTYLIWRRQRHKLAKVIDTRLLGLLTQSVSLSKRKIKLLLEIAALAFFILALARPQSGQTREKVKAEGIELMFLVDVSQSMLAEDVKPSRLDLVKRELVRLVDSSSGDKIGLIAFAGSAIVLSPLTTDHNALKMYIESLSPQTVTTQGTEFRRALDEAEQAFVRGGVESSEGSTVTKAIILVSDGEDQEPGAEAAARKLVDKGIRIFSLGVGTEKGGPIPLRDDHGALEGYLKDAGGQVVVTQTKGTVLKTLAEQGRGSFRQILFGGTAIPELKSELSRLQKSEFDSAEMVSYNERFQPLLLAGILIALLEVLLGDRKSKKLGWKGRFEVGA